MFRHNLRWPLLLAVLFVAQAFAAPAFATCVNPYFCLCSPISSGIVVQAKVLDIQAAPAVVLIEAIDNPAAVPTSLAEGATASAVLAVTNLAVAEYAVGDRFLGIGLNSGGVRSVVRIDKDEHVTCIYVPSFRPTVTQARAIMANSNCPQAMRDSGFKAPTCNDTQPPGSDKTVFEQGCAAGRGGGWRGLVLLSFGALALSWRRRAWVRRRG